MRWTKTPNEIIAASSDMKEAELKLTLVLVRLTFGEQENSVRLTYNDMVERTKMSKGSISAAIDVIEKRGFFVRGRRSMWSINGLKFELFEETKVQNLDQNGSDSELLPNETVHILDQNGLNFRPNSPPLKNREKDNNNYSDNPSPADISSAVRIYENEIGGITKKSQDLIVDAVQEFGVNGFSDAVEAAVRANVRNWNYINAIFRNWRVNGRQSQSQRSSNGTTQRNDDGSYNI